MKNSQLQIRLSAKDKLQLSRLAKADGMSVSEFVLARIFQGASEREHFSGLVRSLDKAGVVSSVAAEMNDFLSSMPAVGLKSLIEKPLYLGQLPLNQAYIAAMLEFACALKLVNVSEWLARVPALPEPWFATKLLSLRAHLLLNSPPPFRRRNLFIDSSIGMRV